MTQKIFRFLRGYSVNPIKIDRLIVSAYVKVNDFSVKNNLLIKEYLIHENTKEYEILVGFSNILLSERESFTIEDIIELFEFVISPAEKEVNGAVYTPAYIRSHIVEHVLMGFSIEKLKSLKYADISCGCGGFFYTLATSIRKKIDISFKELYLNNIYGIDIQRYSIDRTKLLLTLLAISNGEDESQFEFNLYVGNSLNFQWSEIKEINENNGFDIIIGNPPYVSASKIDEKSKSLLENWSVSRTGKPDLYIPFFQIGIENLNSEGILGYITVNNFYRSLNGRGIRNYLSERKHSIKIIDFGSEQVFKGRSTYTCICFIKNDNLDSVNYIASSSHNINLIQNKDFLQLKYANLSNLNGWLLRNKQVSRNIKKIEQTGIPLGIFFEIRNGFATLKNNIFIFSPIKEDKERYYFEKKGVGYWVEKSICKDTIKPNVLKVEEDIAEVI